MRRPELACVLFNAHSRAPQARRGREHHQRFFAQDVCPQIPQPRVHDLAAGQLRCGAHAPSVVAEHYAPPEVAGASNPWPNHKSAFLKSGAYWPSIHRLLGGCARTFALGATSDRTP